MSNNINESLQMKEAEQKNQFFQQGFATYFDVARALHLFQTEVGYELAGVLRKHKDKIKKAMKLEIEVKQPNQDIYPKFPQVNWDCCQIFSKVYLGEPVSATLYIGVYWYDNKVKELVCALVGTNSNIDKWFRVFDERAKSFICKEDRIYKEDWDRNCRAIVMYRPITSLPDNLEGDLEKLLGDFLKFFEDETSQSPNED